MIKKIKKFLIKFFNAEDGQSTTEYIVILSVVVMIALKFKTTFSQKLLDILNNVTSDLNQATQNN